MTTADLTRHARSRHPYRRILLRSLRWIALLILLAFALLPFLWMLRTALSPADSAYQTHPTILPTNLTFDNFLRAVTTPTNNFVPQFINTIIVSVGATAVSLISGVSGAYALSRLKFRGRKALNVTVLLVQLFPPVLLTIPLFLVMSSLKLTNSLGGLIIAYTALSLPFAVWVLRGYLQSLPHEIEDAARVDGCTTFGVLARIVLPTMRPALVAVGTLAFVNSWNEYLLALVLITDPETQILGVGLTTYVSQFSTDLPGLFAMATLTSLPVVVLFLIMQRHLVSGLSAGAVK